ncbi:unnamed protein product [Spirodela intermedia]|uniref:BZIP domain-containing protein n=1 Tax=Spirodela intermedia TaxID=51605 RepID=A0A7I8IXU2_SPIIN|nr:unnamed protein product [Spirodela intermedia]CAA6661972.1 unnamed protein product [Spirodela intermedia]
MAEAAVIDPLPCERRDENEAFDANFAGGFDPLQFPDIPADMTLTPGFMADLDFDADLDFEGDLDFSVADLLDIPEVDDDLLDGQATGGAAPFSSSGSDCKGGSGMSSSSSASGNVDEVRPERLRNLNAPSPDSGDSTTCPAGFRDASSLADEGRVKLEDEEERKGWGVKRKKGREDGEVSDTNINAISRSSKYRRSGSSDQGTSSCVFSAVNEDDEKRRTRLMRNRESAQLSRQRKKHYVEELEEKVRSMHSTITELNLGWRRGPGNCPRPAVYPTPPPMTSMHFPWIPYSGYPARPQGAQVPLVPIPRLKQQQVASAPKPRKSESRKAESKTKKVASVSILGLLFCMLFVGVFVPGSKNTDGRSKDLVWNEEKFSNDKAIDRPRGRVLTVIGSINRPNKTDKVGMRDQKEQTSHHVPRLPGNASKPLFASLYVPRNDKLVKIDGNLIIQSVLASERAMANSGSAAKSSCGQQQSEKERKETSLAIAGTLGLALPVSKSGREMERHAHLYKSIAEYQRARAYAAKDRYRDDSKPGPADAPVKEWFQEGLEGTDKLISFSHLAILSSGMCTEVFSFDVNPATTGGIIPAAAATAAAMNRTANSSHPAKTRNRRTLHPHSMPIPLPGAAPQNGTEGGGGSGSSGRPTSPAMVSSRASSPQIHLRVFVVVLLDSVKYVTYSCVLPFKSPSATHHL